MKLIHSLLLLMFISDVGGEIDSSYHRVRGWDPERHIMLISYQNNVVLSLHCSSQGYPKSSSAIWGVIKNCSILPLWLHTS